MVCGRTSTKDLIRLDTFNTYEYALTKALQVEMDQDYLKHPVYIRIKEKLEIM